MAKRREEGVLHGQLLVTEQVLLFSGVPSLAHRGCEGARPSLHLCGGDDRLRPLLLRSYLIVEYANRGDPSVGEPFTPHLVEEEVEVVAFPVECAPRVAEHPPVRELGAREGCDHVPWNCDEHAEDPQP